MEIKNIRVYGLEESILRAGYPMQTGKPLDFYYEELDGPIATTAKEDNRAKKLANTPIGSGHNNFLKGIIVQFDLQYPEYFSPQLQRYSWIDIISSQSKMHKITSRELTKDDFNSEVDEDFIHIINHKIRVYNDTSSKEMKEQMFRYIINNLPSGYLKWMGISTNYLQLKTIYKQRRHHKLEEWQYFCNWIESLPMSHLITGKNA